MTTPVNQTLQGSANAANPNDLADLFRQLQLGDLLRGQLVQERRHLDPATVNAYGVASTEQVVLPNSGKASVILRATSRAGTSTGELTIDGYTGTAPSADHIGISPNGDLMFAPSADVTNVDVVYVAERGDVVELVMPVGNIVANQLTIPTALTARGVILLAEAEVLAGTSTGLKSIQLPSASAASTGDARLDIAKGVVKFASADAATRARVVLVVAPVADLNAVLDASRTY